MINLFNIPTRTIDTSSYDNLLHGKIVTEFEEKFCEYVGAPYGCSFNSATSAIFLINKYLIKPEFIYLPSMIPIVVPNAIHLAGNKIRFIDNTNWIGHQYILYHGICTVYDSAQQVIRDQAKNLNTYDLMIFSFYPTKPVGGCDGGMVVSHNKSSIEYLRILPNDGASKGLSWEREQTEVGWKMYMNSVQADFALESLKELDRKKEQLAMVRNKYNAAFNLENTSDHLYRITVKDNMEVLNALKQKGITCGIHYKPAHHTKLFNAINDPLPETIQQSKTTLSIPFHENLTDTEIDYVIEQIKKYY